MFCGGQLEYKQGIKCISIKNEWNHLVFPISTKNPMVVTGFACPSDTKPSLADVPITLKKITDTSIDATLYGAGEWKMWFVVIGG